MQPINWQQPQPIQIPANLLTFTGDPLLAQLLAQRGITTPEQARAFLDPTCYQPAPATVKTAPPFGPKARGRDCGPAGRVLPEKCVTVFR